MTSQGPLYGTGTQVQDIGTQETQAWTNPGNIGADDASEAQITTTNYDLNVISQRLIASSLGFSVPAGATIDGIIVEIERRAFAGAAHDNRVQLSTGSTTLIGSNKATATAWPGTVGVATYGSSSDTWSASPTVAMVNNSNFGVQLSAIADADNTDVGVDYIRMTIHYTEAAGGGTRFMSVIVGA